RELGLDPLAEHVKVVPLGTDPEQFKPGLDTREVRARYRLNGDCWAVTVARLEPHKGVDVALRAVAAVRSGGLDLHYLVIGQGKKGREYRKLANELGIGDVVRFTGNVPDRDLPALYNAAQVYLGISRRADMSRVEGFGVALAEASACGLPVIAGIRGTRLRTLNGLALWSWRAGRLARAYAPGFTWCAELKPAGYPARWLAWRRGIPYGVVVHGTELLLLDAKIRRSRFKRWTGG